MKENKELFQQALKEIEEEEYRNKVEETKQKILLNRSRKKYWFPWRLKLVNLNKQEK